MERMQDKMDRMRAKMEGLRGGDWWGTPPSSGNRAFDEYRTETLRRLEDEQREFKEFLERLRFAKDRSEFDQFMAERRNGRPSEVRRRRRNRRPEVAHSVAELTRAVHLAEMGGPRIFGVGALGAARDH